MDIFCMGYYAPYGWFNVYYFPGFAFLLSKQTIAGSFFLVFVGFLGVNSFSLMIETCLKKKKTPRLQIALEAVNLVFFGISYILVILSAICISDEDYAEIYSVSLTVSAQRGKPHLPEEIWNVQVHIRGLLQIYQCLIAFERFQLFSLRSV